MVTGAVYAVFCLIAVDICMTHIATTNTCLLPFAVLFPVSKSLTVKTPQRIRDIYSNRDT